MTQTLNAIQYYEFIFRSSGEGILIADERMLRHLNPAAAAMLGSTPESFIGKTIREAFKGNHALLNLFEREGSQQLDVRLPRRRLAEGAAETLDTGERIVLLRDITEQRDLDTRRDTLIAAIVHDLKNPISAINGFADLIERYEGNPEKQAHFLKRIQQTTTKLQNVIRPLVDLAWIEAGMPLRHVPIRLDAAIKQAVDNVRPLAREHEVSIATSLQTPLPVVMGDPERLEIVIENMLQNAILYSHAQHPVAIHAWGDEAELYCSVADQGIGIHDDEIESIFDRMYRSEDEQLQDIPGHGLGLTVARTIIRRHGGDMWASSNYGEGTVVTFLLPVVQL
ncbi:HAMP domain-containing histidine kinase [Phototrophicus methaneseepsis]|uniref:histidine kinase n=1 Tax=Phototrophicus methaneseepsis TaxID=2710758 RepID=A0A7S8E6Z3_9CHLR|nr:HAMP domain-containing sensor histidine kinase [Phototrophicus methaneseepsis]QPC81528.1 HAMP domain-containing histidine kinase [Phototrophicus methaneseepsis]